MQKTVNISKINVLGVGLYVGEGLTTETCMIRKILVVWKDVYSWQQYLMIDCKQLYHYHSHSRNLLTTWTVFNINSLNSLFFP